MAEIEVLEAKDAEAKAKNEGFKNDISTLLKDVSTVGKVSDLCKISPARVNPQDFLDESFVNIGLEHIESNSGKIIDKPLEFGRQILSTKNVFIKSDVLYGKLRPYLNKVALADFGGICSTDILVLKTGVPLFLKYILLSESFVSQTSDLMAGVSLPRIKVNEFLNVKIPLPSLEEQQKIVSQITEIEDKIAVLESAISNIPQQKEAILKKYL